MIKGINLSKKFGDQVLFENLDISAKPGDFVGIVGNTGCGKSTLLNILSGYEKYDDGEVISDEKVYSNFSGRQINEFRRSTIAFLFQECNLLEDLTVFENLKMSVNFDKKKYHQIDNYIDKLSLSELKHKEVSKLSGGEKQRIAFLRSIIKDFDILICDEPTGNLDDTNARIVMDLIKEECKNKIVIMVTHKKSLANEYFNKLYQYDTQKNTFVLVTNENNFSVTKTSKKNISNMSLLGLLNHSIHRITTNVVFNLLLTLFIILFLTSSGAASVFGAGMFREVQLDTEKRSYPLDEIVLSTIKGSKEDILEMKEVRDVVSKYGVYCNYKFLGNDYSDNSSSANPINPGDSILRVDILYNNEITYNFLTSSPIEGEIRMLNLTEIKGEDTFQYTDLIVGEYPKDSQVLIDVVTASKLLNDGGLSEKNYYNGVISLVEIFRNVKGRYLEIYRVKNIEEDNRGKQYQEIHQIRYEISGIIDFGRASKYQESVYASQSVIKEIIDFQDFIPTGNFVVYKVDPTRRTNENFLTKLPTYYDYDSEVIDLYKEAYHRVKVVVDYNLYLSMISSIIFFGGFLVMIFYIFSHNKYEIAVYRSLGYSKMTTSFILSFSYNIMILIGCAISYLLNRYVVSKVLNYGEEFIMVFNSGMTKSGLMLVGAFILILLSYVFVYSDKPINSIIK